MEKLLKQFKQIQLLQDQLVTLWNMTLSKPKDPSSNKSDVFRRSVLVLVFTGKQNLALSLKTFAIQSKSVRHQLLQLSQQYSQGKTAFYLI